MSVTGRALETIRRHRLAQPGDRVLVALSGGADSVALLFVLRDLEREGALIVAGAAHLHHGLRGADADEDQAFCARLAARLGLPLATERADVAGLARASKRSVEDAARTARHAFFARAAASLGADAVAVAHTEDDQAETFLLRLLRGAGPRGLAGIRPRAGLVIRPLIEISREAVRADLSSRGEAFREDASNADLRFPRNRVRHELLPYLRSQFSPGLSRVLAREAAVARQDEEFLHDQAIELARRIVLTDGGSDRIEPGDHPGRSRARDRAARAGRPRRSGVARTACRCEAHFLRSRRTRARLTGRRSAPEGQ